ncbi:hypothetical protein TrLO_g14818 [Triparma laevis f. longispina]|uniref:COP9 signalosome complex subunit 4 n=1 Tax=Triparma laevis f. longispina TaxID=1714387 RepID=A0A9W7EEP1_9STRA|nr:hypothetical protein TrLO_g14818 [Triparma laevis f. longispina]
MSDQQKSQLTDAIKSNTLEKAWDDLQASQPDAQTLRILSTHLIQNSPSPLTSSTIPPLQSAFRNLATAGNLKGRDNALRKEIFKFYLDQGDYEEAGNALGSLRIDSFIGDPEDPYSFSPAEACDTYITVAECYLEDDNASSAENFVLKANQQKAEVDGAENWALLLRADTCFARVMDAQRKFLQASSKYYELSQTSNSNVNQSDLIVLLGKASTCCILGAAGQQRQRLMALVAGDERLAGLNGVDGYEAHHAVIQKMHQQQIIQIKEMEKFTASLATHQKAKGADGMTIVDKVVMEHNVLAVQRVYESIRISVLAKILETDERNAMKIAAKMIGAKAIEGKIDEVEGILHFTNGGEGPSNAETMNKAIESVCLSLNKVAAIATEEMKKAGIVVG